MQLQIDFVHTRENNHESQAFLNYKREDFNKQCFEVLERMLRGEKITMKSGLETGIGDIRRRAKDLIEKGVPVRREWAKDGNGERLDFKWYFIEKKM